MIADAQLLVMLLTPGVLPEEARAFLQQLRNLEMLPVPPPTAAVRGDWNVRRAPDLNTATVGAAQQGSLWEQWGRLGDWVLVRDVTRETAGWIHQRAFE